MKKVLVTGANGFIGSHVVKELLYHDLEVFAIVRNSNACNLPPHDKLRIVNCEMSKYGEIDQVLKGYNDIDTVYHFAWEGVSGKSQSDYSIQLDNIRNTLALTDKFPILGVRRFIGAGSLHEKECLSVIESEQTLSNMGEMYKVSKLACHHMAKVKACNMGIDFLWPIVTNTYGAGEKSARLINSTVRKMLMGERPKFTKGDQLYDFVYITDTARAFYLIGEYGKHCANYAIGTGNVKPLKEYLQQLCTYVNPNILPGFGEVDFKGTYLDKEIYDIENLMKDTGYKPRVSFLKGIELVLKGIKEE